MLVSVKEIRRSLGKKAKKYTDEQIEGAIGTATVLSGLMIDFFIEREKKRRQQKDTRGEDK